LGSDSIWRRSAASVLVNFPLKVYALPSGRVSRSKLASMTPDRWRSAAWANVTTPRIRLPAGMTV
jgi:hypothetical protein